MRFSFLSPFLLILLLLACRQPVMTSSVMITNPSAPQSAVSYLALGDSYTIGESETAANRWPVQLAGMLRQSGLDVGDPDIIARTGWTTGELQDAIRVANNTKTYGLVSLLIGVNNQYRNQSQSTYRTEFRALLQTAIQFAGGKAGRVVVLSIPDWGQSPYAQGRDTRQIGSDIDAFNAIAADECRQAGVAFVDITPITRQAAGNTGQFASDGLHYSGAQMRQWADKALPVVKQLLSR